jgi:hypothetical protein
VDNNTNPPDDLDGDVVAVLLDQDEYPSNVGNVAAVSDRQICLLRRDRHELINYRLEFFDMADCKAIGYENRPIYYRIVIAIAFFIAAAVAAFLLATGETGNSSDPTPLIIGLIAFVTIGVRFVTSTHRHVISFEMPGEVLQWRSPAIDFKYKADAARAVCEFARQRGILHEGTRPAAS